MRKKTILWITSYSLPSFKNGGLVRSLLNLCRWLGEKYFIGVATKDCDRGVTQAYEGRAPGLWHQVDGAQVWHLPAP